MTVLCQNTNKLFSKLFTGVYKVISCCLLKLSGGSLSFQILCRLLHILMSYMKVLKNNLEER